MPVIVKTSYFLNWTAHGADGPWRATPNFMVVVPTTRDVELEYSTTTAENLGRAGSAAGVVGVAALAVWPCWRKRRPQRCGAKNRRPRRVPSRGVSRDQLGADGARQHRALTSMLARKRKLDGDGARQRRTR